MKPRRELSERDEVSMQLRAGGMTNVIALAALRATLS